MCRSIKTQRPPFTDAVDRIAAATGDLLDHLVVKGES